MFLYILTPCTSKSKRFLKISCPYFSCLSVAWITGTCTWVLPGPSGSFLIFPSCSAGTAKEAASPCSCSLLSIYSDASCSISWLFREHPHELRKAADFIPLKISGEHFSIECLHFPVSHRINVFSESVMCCSLLSALVIPCCKWQGRIPRGITR